MKTFDEFIQEKSNELDESRLLRKGGALLLARSAKKHGDEAVRYLKIAQQKFRVRPSDTPEERIERRSEGLTELCEGLICIRKQNGSAVGIALAAVLLNERTSKQIKGLLKK